MNSMADILLAVANSLWVAALLAGLTGLMLAGLAKSRVTINAATRHWIWWAVLAVVLILPAMPRHVSLRRIHSNLQPVTPAILSPAFPDPPALLVVPAERAPRWPLWVAAIWALLLLYRLQQIFRKLLLPARGQVSRPVVGATTARRGAVRAAAYFPGSPRADGGWLSAPRRDPSGRAVRPTNRTGTGPRFASRDRAYHPLRRLDEPRGAPRRRHFRSSSRSPLDFETHRTRARNRL